MRRENTELKKRWEHHIHQWLQSGKSQVQYCKEHNIAANSFGYWKRKITKSDKNIKLVEIKNTLKYQPYSFVELISPEGMVVRFREDISSNCLKNIVMALKG